MALDPTVVAERMAQSPVIQSLIAGDSPPVYATAEMLSPDARADLPGLQTALAQNGLNLLQAPKTGVFILHNPSIYTPEEILAADEAGTLDDVAVPLSGGGAAPAPAAPAPVAADLIGAATAPAAGAQTDLAVTRTNNVTPKPPTQSPSPASGQIFNGLIKRPV